MLIRYTFSLHVIVSRGPSKCYRDVRYLEGFSDIVGLAFMTGRSLIEEDRLRAASSLLV